MTAFGATSIWTRLPVQKFVGCRCVVPPTCLSILLHREARLAGRDLILFKVSFDSLNGKGRWPQADKGRIGTLSGSSGCRLPPVCGVRLFAGGDDEVLVFGYHTVRPPRAGNASQLVTIGRERRPLLHRGPTPCRAPCRRARSACRHKGVHIRVFQGFVCGTDVCQKGVLLSMRPIRDIDVVAGSLGIAYFNPEGQNDLGARGRHTG